MFVVAASLRSALQKLPHRKLVPSLPTQFRAPHFTFMSTSSAPNVKRPFDESSTSVRINNKEDGEEFVCDEEPHMLSPEQGFGYYPITLGQKLGEDKLEIVRKLGWAGYSSVWLARTLGNAYPAKYVAVKVLTVNATVAVLDGLLLEANCLRTIKSANPNHPGYKHCLHLYDATYDTSYHGPHICLVTNVLGANITSLRSLQPNGHGALPVAVAKRIIKQTLLALDYLHRECNLVHTDVKPDNTLICIDHEDPVITRLLQDTPSATYEPRIEPDLSPEPIITVRSQPITNFGVREDASNLNICLIDYGHATPAKEHVLNQAQPTLLRAPEVILGYPWSTPVDIWSVGCLVFEYLTGAALFKLWDSSFMSLEDVHLQRILEHIGPFPSGFLQACQRRPDFFDEQGSLLRVHNLFPSGLERCLRAYKVMDEKEIISAATFMRRCLTIDPHARPTAMALLDDEWLKDA